jgi:hypothetical protein
MLEDKLESGTCDFTKVPLQQDEPGSGKEAAAYL